MLFIKGGLVHQFSIVVQQIFPELSVSKSLQWTQVGRPFAWGHSCNYSYLELNWKWMVQGEHLMAGG